MLGEDFLKQNEKTTSGWIVQTYGLGEDEAGLQKGQVQNYFYWTQTAWVLFLDG